MADTLIFHLLVCVYPCVHVYLSPAYLSLHVCLKSSQQVVGYSLTSTMDGEKERPLCQTTACKGLGLVKCVLANVRVHTCLFRPETI